MGAVAEVPGIKQASGIWAAGLDAIEEHDLPGAGQRGCLGHRHGRAMDPDLGRGALGGVLQSAAVVHGQHDRVATAPGETVKDPGALLRCGAVAEDPGVAQAVPVRIAGGAAVERDPLAAAMDGHAGCGHRSVVDGDREPILGLAVGRAAVVGDREGRRHGAGLREAPAHAGALRCALAVAEGPTVGGDLAVRVVRGAGVQRDRLPGGHADIRPGDRDGGRVDAHDGVREPGGLGMSGVVLDLESRQVATWLLVGVADARPGGSRAVAEVPAIVGDLSIRVVGPGGVEGDGFARNDQAVRAGVRHRLGIDGDRHRVARAGREGVRVVGHGQRHGVAPRRRIDVVGGRTPTDRAVAEIPLPIPDTAVRVARPDGIESSQARGQPLIRPRIGDGRMVDDDRPFRGGAVGGGPGIVAHRQGYDIAAWGVEGMVDLDPGGPVPVAEVPTILGERAVRVARRRGVEGKRLADGTPSGRGGLGDRGVVHDDGHPIRRLAVAGAGIVLDPQGDSIAARRGIGMLDMPALGLRGVTQVPEEGGELAVAVLAAARIETDGLACGDDPVRSRLGGRRGIDPDLGRRAGAVAGTGTVVLHPQCDGVASRPGKEVGQLPPVAPAAIAEVPIEPDDSPVRIGRRAGVEAQTLAGGCHLLRPRRRLGRTVDLEGVSAARPVDHPAGVVDRCQRHRIGAGLGIAMGGALPRAGLAVAEVPPVAAQSARSRVGAAGIEHDRMAVRERLELGDRYRGPALGHQLDRQLEGQGGAVLVGRLQHDIVHQRASAAYQDPDRLGLPGRLQHDPVLQPARLRGGAQGHRLREGPLQPGGRGIEIEVADGERRGARGHGETDLRIPVRSRGDAEGRSAGRQGGPGWRPVDLGIDADGQVVQIAVVPRQPLGREGEDGVAGNGLALLGREARQGMPSAIRRRVVGEDRLCQGLGAGDPRWRLADQREARARIPGAGGLVLRPADVRVEDAQIERLRDRQGHANDHGLLKIVVALSGIGLRAEGDESRRVGEGRAERERERGQQ